MARSFSRDTAPVFLANPYVVLVDLLIATFFIMVLYVHSVTVRNLAAIDVPAAARKRSQDLLEASIRKSWGIRLQDEAAAKDGRDDRSAVGADKEADWWKSIPPRTELILKRDAAYLKLILLGPPSRGKAFFALRSSDLDPDARALLGQLGGLLARSPDFQLLVRQKWILSVDIEGHTGDEWSGRAVDDPSWSLSVARAESVRRFLGPQLLADPGHFSIIGRGRYQDLPYLHNSPMNRRVQIIIRFTERAGDSGDR